MRIQRFFSRSFVHFAVITIAFLWTLPTVGVLVSSFRPENDVKTSGWWNALKHPFEESVWTFKNYSDVINANGIGEAFVNTLVVTIPATILPITVAAFAAYAFAWMKFPGRDWLFAMVIGLMVVPLQVALIPILRLYTQTGIAGTFLGLWLAHTGFGLPLAIYLLYNYISQLPADLIESAKIDGASDFTAFMKIVLPLSTPAIASFAIFQFLWIWNDLLVSLVFLGTNKVLTVKLSELTGSLGNKWHLLTAGAFVSMVVPLAVFFALQRYFVRGLLAGSVKG
ncbi:MAG TPA: carbohydrate ABC transporter permease [Herpetosiphon sp.]|uniref:Binding-protein-dependent transport systems inner membrane component n=1 Tax=Herpetosiphon aurantiacus (strain ATCC 23779 / DSM 785 / 114-95) TaxID=316274 RepID=A9B0V6_HERA2|nr:carbohydrate ABC transporter permease [Herpetosiphon sp.]ABX03826.1 binding-protein-dependent transport systems inner membrane component [Herpetosiphon aurantiacus DSM 785]HBW48994.1 carbohydrate ABC transporter permease [Herpetosiphon sp.]